MWRRYDFKITYNGEDSYVNTYARTEKSARRYVRLGFIYQNGLTEDADIKVERVNF